MRYQGPVEPADFWLRVEPADGGCSVWTGLRDAGGYGLLSTPPPFSQMGTRLAHRVAYEITYGPFDRGMVVRHRCDNPPCVNPKHLQLGTRADNTRDMMERGRHRPHGLKGEQIYNAVLTEDAVREIRREYRPASQGGYGSAKRLAERFGITSSQVIRVAQRKCWAHVSDEAGRDAIREACHV